MFIYLLYKIFIYNLSKILLFVFKKLFKNSNIFNGKNNIYARQIVQSKVIHSYNYFRSRINLHKKNIFFKFI